MCSVISLLLSPQTGAKGEAEPAAGRHLQRCCGLRPIYLQTWVDVLFLQRIQAKHPLHDPVRRRGVCSSSGEIEQHSKIKHVHLKDTLTFFLILQSIMNWARSDPAYNTDSKLFFFSFVAFASGQVTSYPLAVIRTQQQAQGKPSLFLWHAWDYLAQFEMCYSFRPRVLFSSLQLRLPTSFRRFTGTFRDIWKTWNQRIL